MLFTITSRRRFLEGLTAGAMLAGAAAMLRAEPTQLAARIERAESRHPLMPAIQKAFESLQKLEGVQDYTAEFSKEEKIGRALVQSRMELKLRENPYSVYLKFLQPNAGREVLYVEGRHQNQLLAHDVGIRGLAGTLTLDPTGKMAMDGNRHPCTMIGMRKLAEGVIEQWLNETTLSGAVVNTFPNTRSGNVSTTMVEVSYAQPKPGVKYQMTRLYLENERGFPIRLQNFEFPEKKERQPGLVEDYQYHNIKINVGLQDADFDQRNPKYRF